MHDPEIEAMETDELDDLIRRRLRHTLAYAAEGSEYWARRFDEAGIDPDTVQKPADLLALDPIEKPEFMDRQPPQAEDFGWPIIRDGTVHHASCTSGTSGTEKWVLTNEDDAAVSAEAVRRGFAAAGVGGDDVLVNFLPKGPYMSGRQSEQAASGYVGTHVALGHTNTPPRDRVLGLFSGTALAPDAVFASPSTAEQVARELDEYGVDPTTMGVEAVMLVGEGSDASRRDAIAERFDASVVTNNYATTETGFTAYGSPACDRAGMHVIEDLRLVLIVDPEERRLVDEGEVGEVWVTTLYPEGRGGATPLFNYKPGDEARELGRGVCQCGRTHRRISDVTRSDNTVQIHQAARLTPAMVENAIFRERFRPVLTGEYVVEVSSTDAPRDSVTIRVETAAPSGDPPAEFRAEGLLDRDAVATAVEEEFLRAHVAFRAFTEGGLIHVAGDAVEPGGLPLDGPGKPERIRVLDD